MEGMNGGESFVCRLLLALPGGGSIPAEVQRLAVAS